MRTFSEYRCHYLLILTLLLLLSFFLLFKLTRFHYLGWDESVYLGMAHSIASSGDYGLWEDIRPPLLPLFLSVGFFSEYSVFAAEFVLLLFAFGVLILTYILALHLFNKHAACLSVLLLCLTPLFLFDSMQILTGIPSVFFVLLSFYFFLKSDDKKHLFFAGFFAALAFLMRFPSGLLLIALYALLVFYAYDKKAYRLLPLNLCFLTLGFLLPVLVFMLFNAYLYHSFTANLFDAMLRPLLLGGQHQGNALHAVSGFLANLSFYPLQLFQNNPLFVFSLFSLGFLFFGKSFAQKKSIFVVLLPLLVFSTYFFIITNKQLRFADVSLPFLSLLSAYGFFLVFTWIKERRYSILRFLSALLLFSFIIFSLLQLSAGVQKNLRFFPEQQPALVDDYYSFFMDGGIHDAQILTTDPRFAAYDLHNNYIPFYDTVDVAGKIYAEKKSAVDYVIYDPAFFPCAASVSAAFDCEIKKNELQKTISDENTLALEYLDGRSIWIIRVGQ